ncbi:hypothetical protein CcarbDRAFT_0914 [Clostridium carboxidivorans P7]|uniref:Uncharacterized protein n=1 Tax=Clostridium carboxidivorans P7 TaxID=536227 RepID=C6PQ54_9CLOT|nr:hypothetical protein CcarbDRAFT_0914 [Clostridium carboxidivorans P7]
MLIEYIANIFGIFANMFVFRRIIKFLGRIIKKDIFYFRGGSKMIYFNGEKVEFKKFPNGEAMIHSENLKLRINNNEIKVKFENDEDITHLIFLKGHLDELKVKCSLILPYMPYSRMDRTEGIMIFTLKYLCKLINSLILKVLQFMSHIQMYLLHY